MSIITFSQEMLRAFALGSFPRSQEEKDRSRVILRCAYRGRTRKVRLSIVENCGGPGSGKPGPCPSGRRSDEEIAKAFGVTERGTSKPAGVKPTGQLKGKVGYVVLSKIDLQGERLEEVEPLYSNDDKPVILKKHGDKYRIVDGFGRTNGMLNAGKKRIRAVVVSDRDLSFRTVTGDDESWNRKVYRKYFPNLQYHATTNARPIKTDIRIKELAPYLHDLLGDVTKRDAQAIARIVKRGVERRWKDSSVERAIVRSTRIEPDRAKVIARTEMARARTDVGLGKKRDSDKVVFTLGAVDRTCPRCRALEGKVYTVRKAAGVIPVHPNCRCFWSDAPKGTRVSNVFCATGEGGGVDPSCSKEESRWVEGNDDSTPTPGFQVLKDADGSPKTLYHGSKKNFDEFKAGLLSGFWLTEDYDSADFYTTTDTRYATPFDGEMPAELSDEIDRSTTRTIYRVHAYVRKTANDAEWRAATLEAAKKLKKGDPEYLAETNGVELLRARGYDSVRYDDLGGETVIVFDPNNVKILAKKRLPPIR